MLVVISAVSFGFMPVFARLAYGEGVGVLELLLVRFALAFLVIGVLLRLTGRNLSASKNQLLFLSALGGIGYFLQATLYFNSLLYIPVPAVALILYTYPVFVTVGSLALGFEKASASLALSLILALAGLYLVVTPIHGFVLIGFLMALGAAITYTVYILVSTRVLKKLGGEVASFWVMGSAALSFTVYGLFKGGVHMAWGYGAWVWLILISVVSTAVAATTFFQGLKLVGPSTSSILSLIEPITSVIAASILFDEFLSVYQLIGGLLVLLAASIVALFKPSK